MKVLGWVVAGLLLASTSFAGSPSSININKAGAFLEVVIVQSDSLAASGIDTTASIDMKDVYWTAGNAAVLTTQITALNDGTSGDSLSVVVQASVDGSAWASSISAFVMSGQAGSEQAATYFARYMRFLITNNDENGHTYTLRVQAPIRFR
jgi:hypothetical protein